MLVLNGLPINTNSDDDHYETLVEIQPKADMNYDTLRNHTSIPIRSTVAVQRENGGLWTNIRIMEQFRKGD